MSFPVSTNPLPLPNLPAQLTPEQQQKIDQLIQKAGITQPPPINNAWSAFDKITKTQSQPQQQPKPNIWPLILQWTIAGICIALVLFVVIRFYRSIFTAKVGFILLAIAAIIIGSALLAGAFNPFDPQNLIISSVLVILGLAYLLKRMFSRPARPA